MIPRYASYRDPRSSVTEIAGQAVRTFDDEGAKAFLAVKSSGVLDHLVSERQIQAFEIVSRSPLRISTEIVPFVSYPPEWTPEMLREAALLTIAISKTLWKAGHHLRDASAYNIIFNGPNPVFVDLGSMGAGRTKLWNAYGQFCDHFLSPLLIEAHQGIAFGEIWDLDGVDVHKANALIGGRERYRPSVLTNVVLRSRLERRHENSVEANDSVRRNLELSPTSIENLMNRLERTIQGLRFLEESTWANYERENSYTPEAEAHRSSVIRSFALQSEDINSALDLGANVGNHSKILAETFNRVIAIDSDRVAVERHRGRLKERANPSQVFSVVADMARPTPALGFMNQERADLLTRIGRTNATIWMALIHHLVIGNSVPFPLVADLAFQLGDRHLLEFVAPSDPMSGRLSAMKSGEHPPYTRETFEAAFKERFRLNEVGQPLETRTLYLAER